MNDKTTTAAGATLHGDDKGLEVEEGIRNILRRLPARASDYAGNGQVRVSGPAQEINIDFNEAISAVNNAASEQASLIHSLCTRMTTLVVDRRQELVKRMLSTRESLLKEVCDMRNEQEEFSKKVKALLDTLK